MADIKETIQNTIDLAQITADTLDKVLEQVKQDDEIITEAEEIIKRLVKDSGKSDAQAEAWFKKIAELEESFKKAIPQGSVLAAMDARLKKETDQ